MTGYTKTISVEDFWRMLGRSMTDDESRVQELVDKMTDNNSNETIEVFVKTKEKVSDTTEIK